MMIKLKILNMKNFLKVVNHCKGRVFVVEPDGIKTDINGRFTVQKSLNEQFLKNKKYLPLTLDFDNPRDYQDVVSYYAGDC